jgi:hypothetical protein
MQEAALWALAALAQDNATLASLLAKSSGNGEFIHLVRSPLPYAQDARGSSLLSFSGAIPLQVALYGRTAGS